MINSNIINWSISQVTALPRWTYNSGKFVLMGDAAHAMAFYPSMGVSMAVEDAVASTKYLALIESEKASLGKVMKMFEGVRKERVIKVRDASLHAGNVLQFPAGEERNARDQKLRQDAKETVCNHEAGDFWSQGIAYGISDRRIRDRCYSSDVVKEVREV